MSRVREQAVSDNEQSRTNGRPASGLRIGAPNDQFEREADRVSEDVTSGSGRSQWSISRVSFGASVQRKCACRGSGDSTGECEECKEKKVLQRKAAGPAQAGIAPPIVHSVLNSPGQPLDRPTRDFFEPRFGRDLGSVRVHLDANAVKSAETISAVAYTVGNDLVFGRGHFSPETHSGQKLLAHELTHSIQQTVSPEGDGIVQRQPTPAPAGPYTGYTSFPAPAPPPGPQPAPVELPKTTITDDQAFAKLHDMIAVRIDGIDSAAANLKRGVTTEKKAGLQAVVAQLRAGLQQADKSLAAYKSAGNDPDRAVNLKQAAGRYQGMLLMTTIAQLDASMLTVADWADQEGVPSGLILDAVNAEENDPAITALWTAARSQDVAKMVAALPPAAARVQHYIKFLDDWIASIGRGAVLSHRVQKIADILLLAASIYEVAKIPALPASAPTPTIRISGRLGGVAAASAIPAIDVAAVLESIRKLVAIGALDPALIAGVGTLAGGPGTRLGELSQPTNLMVEAKSPSASPESPARTKGGGGRTRVEPFEKKVDDPVKKLPEVRAARRRFADQMKQRLPKGTQVDPVSTERTEAGRAQAAAVTPEDSPVAMDVELKIKLPDGTTFKPDGVKFLGSKGYLFQEHKQVLAVWEKSHFSKTAARRELEVMLQERADIYLKLKDSGCRGFMFTTNDNNLADLIGEIIGSMKGPGRQGLLAPSL